MKATSGLFAVILVLWMGASYWWYVCKIKDKCDYEKKIEISEIKNIKVKLDEPINVNLSDEERVEDVKNKLSAGYTVHFFPENSTKNNDIEREFYEFVYNLKLYLQQNIKHKIVLTGHTDNIGSDAANFQFGLKRAQFIKQVLTDKGIDKKRITLKSKGEKEPIASNETEEGKNQNRRVVIKLIDK